jgi:CheY-like chemotaxis protein
MRHVLVVDDNPVDAEASQRRLAPLFRVSVASSIDEALRVIAEDEPDVVVTDLLIPPLDGVQAIKRIEAEFRGPIIGHTSHPVTVLRGVAHNAGADCLMPKDRGDHLLDEVQSALHRWDNRKGKPLERMTDLLIDRAAVGEENHRELLAEHAKTRAALDGIGAAPAGGPSPGEGADDEPSVSTMPIEVGEKPSTAAGLIKALRLDKTQNLVVFIVGLVLLAATLSGALTWGTINPNGFVPWSQGGTDAPDAPASPGGERGPDG